MEIMSLQICETMWFAMNLSEKNGSWAIWMGSSSSNNPNHVFYGELNMVP